MKTLWAVETRTDHFALLSSVQRGRYATGTDEFCPILQILGWEAEVVCVDQKHSEMVKDRLLLQSLPAGQVIHTVDAFNKKWTGKLGLGSLALRSLWYYIKTVNMLLKTQHYDLIYFSTTQFPVTILGRYWKSIFNIPYIIDMQDPWHSDYYRDKPKNQRPKKYWFSYRLNKWLEPVAMKNVDGLIGVSESYIITLKSRYRQIKNIPAATITFGYYQPDMQLALANKNGFAPILNEGTVNIVYAGRGGTDMHSAIRPVFEALRFGLTHQFESFNKLRFYFIGTSYAPAGQGQPSIEPLAKEYDVSGYVIEMTDRISYYHTLTILQQASALFLPGSDDAKYTASKLYPYLLSCKPVMAIFHRQSSALEVLRKTSEGPVILSLTDDAEAMKSIIYHTLANWAAGVFTATKLLPVFEYYSAENLTRAQTELFNKVINNTGS